MFANPTMETEVAIPTVAVDDITADAIADLFVEHSAWNSMKDIVTKHLPRMVETNFEAFHTNHLLEMYKGALSRQFGENICIVMFEFDSERLRDPRCQ